MSLHVLEAFLGSFKVLGLHRQKPVVASACGSPVLKYGNPPLRSEKQRDEDLLLFPAAKAYEWFRSSGHKAEEHAKTVLVEGSAHEDDKQNRMPQNTRRCIWNVMKAQKQGVAEPWTTMQHTVPGICSCAICNYLT